jgi:uncharacterized protein YndB with AHSA1/START domain
MATTQNGKAATGKKTFSRTTSVGIDIKADPEIIWKLLTNAADFPRWNSTVISINGHIAPGEKIKLKSKLSPERTFSLTIKKMETQKKLAWGDAMGTRSFMLANNGNGTVSFYMSEKIGGPLFPLFAKHIPPFDQSFEQFAADLKKEAETING